VIEAVTVWINNYPRKILGYMTADRLFQAHLSAILGAA
jgi:IS30 family transposase